MYRQSIQVTLLGLATISVFLISNGVSSYAQTNYPDPSVDSNSSLETNTTGTTNATALQSDNPVAQSIDSAIKSINDGDTKSGKKSLLEAEDALEGKADLVNAEKHIEASLQALKEGDSNGAISHAESAKANLI